MNRRHFLSALLAAPVVHEVEPVRRVYSFLWSNPFAPIVLDAWRPDGEIWHRLDNEGRFEMQFVEREPADGVPIMVTHVTDGYVARQVEEREQLRLATEQYARHLGRLGRVEFRL